MIFYKKNNICKLGALGDVIQLVELLKFHDNVKFYTHNKHLELLRKFYPEIEFVGCTKITFLLNLIFRYKKNFIAHSHWFIDIIFLFRLAQDRILTENYYLLKYFPKKCTQYSDQNARTDKLKKLIDPIPVKRKVLLSQKKNNKFYNGKVNVGIIPFGGNAQMSGAGRQFADDLLESVLQQCMLYTDIEIVVVGVPSNKINLLKNFNSVTILSDRETPDRLFSFYENCDAFITSDVGLSHFAINSGKPVFHYSGATDFNLIYDHSYHANICVNNSEVCCSPCYFEKGTRRYMPEKCEGHICMKNKSHVGSQQKLHSWLKELVSKELK